MGVFDEPWLGIPPTHKIAILRYAECLRADGGRITGVTGFWFFDMRSTA